MCLVRDLFRVSVSKSFVNGPGNRVDCVDGRRVIANLFFSFRVLSCWLKVNCKVMGVECVKVPLVEDKYQESRKSVYLCMFLSELYEGCYTASP